MARSVERPPARRSSHVVERATALALLAVLAGAALTILAPFASVLLWAVFMTVTLWPVHCALERRLGGHARIAATLSVAALFVAVIIPLSLASVAVVPSIKSVAAAVSDPARWHLPPPPSWIEQMPVVGQTLHGSWHLATEDAGRLFETYKAEMAQGAGWLLGRVLLAGLTLVQLVLAAVLTWPMLVGARHAVDLLRRLVRRVGGDRPVGLLDQSARTIRSVSVGVFGSALLLAGMQGLGLWMVGVPLVGLLVVASFVLATAQLGSHIVYLGAVGWLLSTGASGRAAFTAAWGLVANYLIDTGLRPYLISRGTGLPLSVIFLGVTGGLLAWGFVGLFLGPTLLGVAWTLLRGWLQEDGGDDAPAAAPAGDAPPAGPAAPPAAP